MKQHRKIHTRILAAALAAALAVPAEAAGFGSFLRQDGLELSDTAQMVHSQRSLTGGGQVVENFVTYRPESGLKPLVAYGSTLYGRSNLDYVADYLTRNGMTPTAGVNGSFFTMANGVPIGAIVTNGIVRSASSTGNAVGFRADGTAIIGQPQVTVQVAFPNGETGAVHYNKTVNKGNGMVLYSGDFDTQTRNTLSCYNAVLRPDSNQLTFGKTIRAQVTAVTPDTASCAIPAGCFVLSMATETDYTYTFQHQLGSLQVGDTVTIDCTAAAGWEDVTDICGADELLVEHGAARTAFTLDSAKNRVARTAAGLREDGTLILYTVDHGGSGYSTGMTLAELAERMAELGCETAVNLDGGGSTTFSAKYPGNGSLTNVNKPSDGSQRKCANFIFLARPTTAAGAAAHLHLYPFDAAVLAGGRLTLTPRATDAAYNPADLPGGITYTATGGAVTEDGVFTAGTAAGTATVRAEAAGASGSRNIRVVTDPTSITVKNQAAGQAVTAVTVAAGKTLDLTAAAVQYGYSLVAQDDCFTWSVSGDIGTIDENGLFTAAETTAARTGTITCAAGSARASVAVTLTPLQPEGGAVHGFEPAQLGAVSGEGLLVAGNRDLGYVRYGSGSLQARYDLTQVAGSPRRQVRAALSAALPADCDTVGLWVWGDGSNNSLSLLFDAGGETASKWLCQLNFTGWKYVSAPIPAGAAAVTGFAVTEYEEATATGGTIYLDQLIAARGALSDTTPPAVSAALSGGKLQVSADDDGSGLETLTVTVDGQSAAVEDGLVTLPADGRAHQARITAADLCGNLAAKTVEIPGTLESPFADMDGHWAGPYVDYCHAHNILSGAQDAAGNLRYRPDAPMTRQEFAVALVRFLETDVAQYAGTALPFADSAAIADWALDAMRTAYALGLVSGSRSGADLYANPDQTITRQEAMTILDRTQARGYAADPLTSFADAAAVESWAGEHVASMVARGIISGAGGRLNPAGAVTRGQVAKMLYYLY